MPRSPRMKFVMLGFLYMILSVALAMGSAILAARNDVPLTLVVNALLPALAIGGMTGVILVTVARRRVRERLGTAPYAYIVPLALAAITRRALLLLTSGWLRHIQGDIPALARQAVPSAFLNTFCLAGALMGLFVWHIGYGMDLPRK